MLKNLRFSGIYHDERLAIHVLLENPADYGLEATKMVFSITVKDKDNGTLRLEDFTFYVMDEANYLHNTRSIPVPIIEIHPDNEPVYLSDWLILVNFNHDFLFQDLRIAFYCRPFQKFSTIELNH
jgi:hypothetical protein